MNIKTMKSVLLFLVLWLVFWLWVGSARAETYLDVHISSHHLIGVDKDYNERNYGLGITNDDYSYGFYENSYNRTSVYVFGHTSTDMWFGSAGLNYGAVTGYEYMNVMPIILPFLTFGSDDLKLVVGALPNVITFSLQIKM